MKKRIVAIICAILAAVSLFACTRPEPNKNNNSGDKEWTGFY